MRSALPAVRAASVVAIPVALLVAGAVPASAAESTSRSEMAFGLLGPVGLIAVALGIVGMAFGVFRQRRKARAAAAPAPAPAAPAQSAAPHVAAMAEAVLTDDALARQRRP
ncbi:hypothetical protein GCM10027598_13060 [Amycolatopsis oliviviridis]|uniref:Uncharacterized protein n=1 Tax=Amycolatopsis oliviviridis TaxID=1471590 RepID=A0ABQ3LW48_9PSEU|nr:hypothetical protein [Amycolatopsis oliviviridis]GHH26179.1 hypothetical protein GCM10017790_53080 [Amycolatopsis oliviviridis]